MGPQHRGSRPQSPVDSHRHAKVTSNQELQNTHDLRRSIRRPHAVSAVRLLSTTRMVPWASLGGTGAVCLCRNRSVLRVVSPSNSRQAERQIRQPYARERAGHMVALLRLEWSELWIHWHIGARRSYCCAVIGTTGPECRLFCRLNPNERRFVVDGIPSRPPDNATVKVAIFKHGWQAEASWQVQALQAPVKLAERIIGAHYRPAGTGFGCAPWFAISHLRLFPTSGV